ncbi:MAG: ABC transporter substrate-binding protein, partial [Chloroflexota bacterium]|nr:ABC transporter substrate-binding protein [Chloroflexota bacterium]
YTKDVMGTGPFKLVSYLRGVSIDMVKNPDYFVPGRPYMDGIMRYIIKDYGAMNAAFKAGKLDALLGFQHNVGAREREVLKKQYPTVVIDEKATPTARVLIFNHTRKPFNDVRLRTALDLVLERRAFITVAAQGDARLGGMVFPGFWAMPQEELLKRPGYRQPKDQDIAEAKRLLTEAGFPNGLKFTITTRSLADYTAAAVLIQDQAKAIGLDVRVEVLEGATYFSREAALDFETVVSGSSITLDEPDLYLGHSFTTGGGQNYGKYSNPKVDELYVKQAQAKDQAERKKLISELEKIIMEDRPLVPFYWRTYSSITWPYVRNFNFQGNQLGFKLQDVWLAAQ